MADVYAKIQSGVVVNLQMMTPSVDTFDPTFIWVDLSTSSFYCADGTAITIGTLYDGTNFTQPSNS